LRAELAADAGSAKQFPRDGLPEVAVAGRSNVGKSSFINALLGRRQLARTSATPGKTRRIHFYRMEDVAYLVDLPGYGYASVSRSERAAWGPLVQSYLRAEREPLRAALVLVDLRRGPGAEELDLIAWLEGEGLDARAVLTKLDKLRASERARRIEASRAELGLEPYRVCAVSSRTGEGLSAVGHWMHDWTGLELRRPDGSPLR
jgi:GTP-binding protein